MNPSDEELLRRDLVREVWREVLNVDDIADDDDFFEIGGHSLAALMASSKVGKLLGRDIPVRLLFDHAQLAGYAAQLHVHLADG